MTPAWRAFLISTLSLVMFFWGLYRMPMPQVGAKEVSENELRELREDLAIATRLGKWPRALRASQKLHEAYPGEPIYLASRGLIYGNLGRYREAAEIWSEYLDHSPTPVEACPQAAQAYERQGLMSNAIRVYERCLSFEPENPDSIFYLAHTLERNGQTERAEELYRRGIQVRPDNPDLAVGLARVRLRQGQVEEARKLLTAGRLVFAAFHVVTALYCVLCFVPFTYHQVISCNLLSALNDAAAWHARANVAAVALLIVHLPAQMRAAVAADPDALAFSTDITPSLYYLLGHRPVVKHELFGSPLFTEGAAERARDPRGSYLLAASYGPVYGILSSGGRRLYVADGVNHHEYVFDLETPGASAPSAGPEARDLIRRGILAINRFYHFGETGTEP